MLLSQRGLIRIRLGDPKGALSDYQLAEPMLRDEPAELARIGINRGNIFLDQAIVESAIVDFTMAAQQYRLLGNTIGEAKAIGNLGYAYMLAGDLVRALRLINESAVMLERESPALLPVADQDLAEALVAAGRPEEALRLLRRAAAQFGARRQRLRQAGAELTLAQLLAWEDPGRAIRLARSATTRFERAGAPRQALRSTALRTACALSLGIADAAEAERLLAECLRLGMRRDALTLRVLLTGYSRRASELRLPPNTPLPLRLIAADLRAGEAESAGRPSRAMRIIRDALDQLAAWQASFGSLDLQTSAASHAQPLLERGLRLAVATRRPGVVHQWIERTGALTGRLNPLRPPANPELAERLTRLRALSQEDEPSADDLHERDQLLRVVREQSWMGEGAAELHDLVTLGRLQGELADCDATLIALFSVGPDAFALSVTATSTKLVRVCATDDLRTHVGGLPADLDLAAADLPPMIAESVVDSLRERLSLLDDLILGPVRSRIRTKRVVVNPIGAFSGLPWTLMPTLAGRSVTIPRSASAWVTARAKPHEYATSGFAAGPRLPRSAEARQFALAVIVAFIPAAVAGLLLHGFIKRVLFSPEIAPTVIATTLILGGFVILVCERIAPKPRYLDGDRLPLSKAFQIGLCQILAIIPGVSRSGATILGGELLGVDRKAAALFTFYLAVPTMLGATVLDLYKNRDVLSAAAGADIAVGFVTAFLVALVVVKGFVAFVGRYGLKPFAWYRIALGLVIFGVLAFRG